MEEEKQEKNPQYFDKGFCIVLAVVLVCDNQTRNAVDERQSVHTIYYKLYMMGYDMIWLEVVWMIE